MVLGDNLTAIYLAHNRLFYTMMTLPVVIGECKRSGVHLIVFDDMSTDGTSDYIDKLKADADFTLIRQEFGNSTDQINYCINNVNTKYIYKIDNDILIPNDTFNFMYNIIEDNPNVFFLMMMECGNMPKITPNYKITNTSHNGGIGIINLNTLKEQGVIEPQNRFFGFTHFQNLIKASTGLRTAAVDSYNTNLDMSIWANSFEYEKLGYCRNLIGKKWIENLDNTINNLAND